MNWTEIQQYRVIQSSPYSYLETVEPMMERLGVTGAIDENPEKCLGLARNLDPRNITPEGELRDQQISRQELASEAGELPIGEVALQCARAVGMMTDYPFDGQHYDADAVLVTGGAMSAMEDRTIFAMSSDVDIPIYIAGSNSAVSSKDKLLIAELGLNPDDFPTEAQLAELVKLKITSERRDDRLRVYLPVDDRVNNNRAMFESFLAAFPGVEFLSGVTTDLYVPFTALDGGGATVGTRRMIRVYAGESTAEKIEARSPKVYMTDIIRGYKSATRWIISAKEHDERIKRSRS